MRRSPSKPSTTSTTRHATHSEPLAAVSLEANDTTGATRLLGAAAAARQGLGARRITGEVEWLEHLREQRGPALDSEEAPMTLSEAIAWARRMRGRRKRPLKGWDSLPPPNAKSPSLPPAA
jgi:hypothetical protein